MYVAMKDLEIRGAGNLLGGEQSGHIEGVGFDLYVRMVGEAVAHFKGERPEEVADVKIDLPVDAHLPYDYISVERLRLEMYRKLADVRDETTLDEVVAEMTDRYGTPPEPVANLIAVARFRLLARAYGLHDVSLQGKHVRFGPMAAAGLQAAAAQAVLPGVGLQAGHRSGVAAPARPPAGSVASHSGMPRCWRGAPSSCVRSSVIRRRPPVLVPPSRSAAVPSNRRGRDIPSRLS